MHLKCWECTIIVGWICQILMAHSSLVKHSNHVSPGLLGSASMYALEIEKPLLQCTPGALSFLFHTSLCKHRTHVWAHVLKLDPWFSESWCYSHTLQPAIWWWNISIVRNWRKLVMFSQTGGATLSQWGHPCLVVLGQEEGDCVLNSF